MKYSSMATYSKKTKRTPIIYVVGGIVFGLMFGFLFRNGYFLLRSKYTLSKYYKKRLERSIIRTFEEIYANELPPKITILLKDIDVWVRLRVLQEYYPIYFFRQNPFEKYEESFSDNKFIGLDGNELLKCRQIIQKYNKDNTMTMEEMKQFRYVILCQSKYDVEGLRRNVNEFPFRPQAHSIDEFITIDPRGWSPKDFALNIDADEIPQYFPYRHFQYAAIAYCPLRITIARDFVEKFIQHAMQNHSIVEFPGSIPSDWIPMSDQYILKQLESDSQAFQVIHRDEKT